MGLKREHSFLVGGLVAGGLLVALVTTRGDGEKVAPADADDKRIVIPLVEVDTRCVVGKPPLAVVKKGKKITFFVDNNCKDPQTIAVGNFRGSGPAGTDCSAATAGGTVWPFDRNDESPERRRVTVEPRKEDSFALNGADNTISSVYVFDMCHGTAVLDPQLVIEP